MDFLNVTGPKNQEMSISISSAVPEQNFQPGAFMEVEPKPPDPDFKEEGEVFSLSKETNHLLRIDLLAGTRDELINKAIQLKEIISDEIRINILKSNLHLGKKSILMSFEEEHDMMQVTRFNFEEKGIQLITKILTGNKELDSRKVKVSRPSTEIIRGEEIEKVISMNGKIEELYEVRGNPKKRTFVVAFERKEDKSKFLVKTGIFIGSLLYKISDYVKGPTDPNEFETLQALTIRIGPIKNSNTEFTVRKLLLQMKAKYWHIPTSMNKIKLPIVVATLSNQNDLEWVLKCNWMFENRPVYVSRITDIVCYRCGKMDHFMQTCPMAPKIKTNENENEKIKNPKKSTKILKTIDDWKQETSKFIQANSSNSQVRNIMPTTQIDNDSAAIRNLREMIETTNEKVIQLQEDNEKIRDEMQKNQEKSNLLIEKVTTRQIEFSNQQVSIKEIIAKNDEDSKIRHMEIMNFLRRVYSKNNNQADNQLPSMDLNQPQNNNGF